MTALDRLRAPPTLDLRAPAYKDWLHLNVFDHAAGMVTLFNASLHGDPDDPRSLAVGTVVAADLGGELAAEVVVADLGDAELSPTSIGVGDLLTVSLDGDRVEVTARLPTGRGEVAVEMVPTAPPIIAETPVRFGSGWIAWRASPRGMVEGSWLDGGRGGPMDQLAAYHDHNWGRWHWGDDAGWEWAALLAEDGATIVLTHTTDREHRTGSPVVLAVFDGAVRRFPGGTVSVGHHGHFAGTWSGFPGRWPRSTGAGSSLGCPSWSAWWPTTASTVSRSSWYRSTAAS